RPKQGPMSGFDQVSMQACRQTAPVHAFGATDCGAMHRRPVMKPLAPSAARARLWRAWTSKLVMWFVVAATAASATLKLLHQPPAGITWPMLVPMLLTCIAAGPLIYVISARGRRDRNVLQEEHSFWGIDPVIEELPEVTHH